MAGSLENRGKLRELIDKFQFADMFGVSRQAVSKWESDKLIVLLYYQTLYWWSKRTGKRI